jgi:transposase
MMQMSTGPLSHPRFALITERIGSLPLINHFLERMDLLALLEQYVPTRDSRCAISHAQALGVLLRSIVVEREPLYRQQETVHEFAPQLYGLSGEHIQHLSDDRVGRALDRLFDADRAALLTAVVVTVGKRFGVQFDEVHNDSTSVSVCGQYREAEQPIRGRLPALLTYGHSKDHRPDLKQLVLILTTTEDGGVPVQFRVVDGNTNDSVTHIESWNALRAVTGRADFLYVADSKLCSSDNMDRIHRDGGRFVTVIPRTRREDKDFRKWLQTHTPPWQLVWDRPHPRRRNGPPDRWYVYLSELPSAEAWPVVWVWSTLLTKHHEESRQRRINAAVEALNALRERLASARARLRGARQIDQQVALILSKHKVSRYVHVQRTVREAHEFKQARRGRPGPDTAYRKITHHSYDIEWKIDQAAIDFDHKSDGIFPLLTNDRNLAPAEVLQAYKGQPTIEKRFEQLKTVHEIAPVFLKNPGRIEAFFTVYFLALLVQSLIERHLRLAMQRQQITHLPLYAEQRQCKRPTTEQILRLFGLLERHTLQRGSKTAQVFNPELTSLQRQILGLLDVPQSAFVL